jgi:hypothetical protein
MNACRLPLAGIVIFGLTCLFACDQNAGQETRVPDTDLEAGRITAAANQILVIETVGDVRVSLSESAQPEETAGLIAKKDAGFRLVEAGEFLLGTQTLKTGWGASCCLQFGTAAVIRLNPMTEVKLEDVSLRPGEVLVTVKMKTGELICRVNGLAGKERFRVHTPTAAFSIQTADFAISAIGDSITLIGVNKGMVGCLPLGIFPDQIQMRASRTDAILAQAVNEFTTDTVMVGESRQAGVTSEMARVSAEALQLVSDELEKLAGQMTITPAEKKTFVELVRKTGVNLKNNIKFADSLGGAQKKLVDRIEGLRLLPLAVQTGFESKPSTAPSAAPGEQLVRIFIKTSPADANIDLNGDDLGQGAYRAILPMGQLFTYTITAAGFTPQALPLRLDAAAKKSYEIVLVK